MEAETSVTSLLHSTLTNKQDLVRRYQDSAEKIKDPDIAGMYRQFAEAEALHAAHIKQTLQELYESNLN